MAKPTMAKNTVCLWYDNDAEDAARFYAETFPDSAVGEIYLAPSDNPSTKAGEVIMRQRGEADGLTEHET